MEQKLGLNSFGRIPAGQECPYREECFEAKDGLCKHKGVEHTVEFSCGYARYFHICERGPYGEKESI